MAKKKRDENQGGLQAPKMSVAEKEELKAQKERSKKREGKPREKKERKGMVKTFREVGGELKKVRWPSFGKTVTQTGIVLSVVVIFGLVVFGIDQGLGALYGLLVRGLGGS